MNSIKLVCHILIALQISLTSMSFASITRTRTMGDVGMILRDNANLWLFPATIIDTPNRAIVELGGEPELFNNSIANYGFNQWAGGTISLQSSKQSTIGVFLSEATSVQLFQAFSAGALAATQKLDLFFGSKTDYGSYGLHLSRAAGSQKAERDPGSDSKTSVTQTKLALGFTGKALEVAFSYQLATSSSGSDDIYGHLLNFRARQFRNDNAKLDFVPFVDLSLGFEDRSSSAAANAFIWKLWSGAGLQYLVDKGDVLVMGISVMRFSQSTKVERVGTKTGSAILDLPFIFGGFESELFAWLKLRLGVQKALRWKTQSSEYSNTSAKDVRTESPFALSAGLGIEYKRFTMDFSWDSDLLKRGPYFVSGEKGEMFNLISMQYQF